MTLEKFLAGAVASAAFALAAGTAQAATYQFTLTGDYAASWQMPSTATPDVYSTGYGLTFWDVAGFPDAYYGTSNVLMFSTSNGGTGGLELYDYWGNDVLFSSSGPQLYTGTEAGPVTFKLGVFALTQYGGGPGRYTLTVVDPSAAAVPEPASIAMLLAGLGVVCATVRRRKA